MADKFKKIEKEFVLSDSSVNSYGFRLATGGYQLDEFKKNPIGYLMHKREDGVLVKWDDLRVEGDKVLAKPVINMSNANAQKTVDEIENGFLNAASVGHIVALEASDDRALKWPNQTGPTVTKWFNREASLVDIPGNYNALALYDQDGHEINLADFTKTKMETMQKIELTAAQLAALNLKADADAAAIHVAFNNLVATVETLKTQLGTAQKELIDFKAATTEKEVADLVATGVANKKLTVEVGEKLKKQYTGKPVELKDLIDSMPNYHSVTDQLKGQDNKEDKRYAELAAKTGNELMESGEMEKVKKEFPQLYTEKMQEIKNEVNGK